MSEAEELRNVKADILSEDELNDVNAGWIVRDKTQNAWIAVSEDGNEIYGTFYDEPSAEGEVNCSAIGKATACARAHGARGNAFYGTVAELRNCIKTNNWEGYKLGISEPGCDPLQWLQEHNLA